MLERGARLSMQAVASELRGDLLTYGYLTISTTLMFTLLGTALGTKEDRMRALMMTDALTGLFNRRYLNQRLLDELARVARYGGELSLLVIDVDRFKQVNDL